MRNRWLITSFYSQQVFHLWETPYTDTKLEPFYYWWLIFKKQTRFQTAAPIRSLLLKGLQKTFLLKGIFIYMFVFWLFILKNILHLPKYVEYFNQFPCSSQPVSIIITMANLVLPILLLSFNPLTSNYFLTKSQSSFHL